MTAIPPDLHRRAREICLALPEAVEKETWGHPTFRVRDKMFVTMGTDDESGDLVVAMTMKAPPGDQEALLATGEPFFYPRYVGTKGWIGITLGAGTDWDQVAELVEDSYRLIAPKKLVAQLDD